jgi:parallel beta-helix repeat protein
VSSDVVTLFHKSAPLPLPVTTPGPVVADGREFISIGYALYDIYYGGEERRFDGVPSRFSGSRTAGQSGTQAGLPAKQMAGLRTMNANTVSLIEVNIAGLAEYEYDVDLENDGMTLRGAGKDLSYIDLSGDRIDVYANGVTIEKLDLDNLYMLDVETGNTVSLRGPGWEGYSGWRIIDVDEYNNAKIKNNRIRGASGYGVSVRWSTGTLVENNEIFWNGVSGVYDYYAENTTIRGNTIFENGSLYYNLEGKRSPAGEATTTAAASNTSYPSYGAGIYGRYTEGAVITNNDVFDNVGHGVYLYNISESNIVNNRIYDNGWIAYDNDGGSGSGLVLDAGNGYYNTANAIVGNTIANNAGEGVYDYYSNYNIYSNNVIGEATLQTSTRRAQRATGGLSLKRSTNSAPRHAVSLKRSAVNEAARSHEEAAWAKLSKDEMLTKLRSQWEAQRALAKATREQEREDDSREATQRRDGSTQRALKKSGSTPALGRLTTPNLSSRQLTPLDGNLLTGVYFDYARNAILSGNTIRGNDTEDEYGGVFLSNSSRDNLVVGNTIENNGSIGIQLDSDYNHNNIIVANRILNNSENGVWVDNNNSGTLVQFNVIAGHTQYGVRNVGTTEANRVDARYSYWGAADGPGGTNVNDPVTNKLASGTGNNVSANVRFDPFVPVVPSALAASTVPGSVTDTVIVFGNTGITVNFSPTGSGGLLVVGSFNITPPTGPFQDPSGGTTFQFLNRYWEIVEGGMTGFTSSITFSYAGVSGVTNPSGLRIARRANFSGSGVPWVLVAIGNTIINTSNQTITVTGITDFSQWTLLMVPSAPTVASVTPSQAFRGASMQLDIAGTNFNSTTALNFGNDISVSSLQLLSPNQLRAIIVIPAAAALGQRAVTISNGGPGGGSSTFNFLVLNPSPTVFSISPQSGNRGSSATVTVNGSGFIPGLGGTTLDFGGGITVGFVSVISGNQLTASISIANTATAGTKTVTVANSAPGGGAATTSFTVNNPAPTVTSVTPNSGTQGQTLTVSLGGSGFFAGVTTVGFGAGVTVNSVVMISSSLLQASITIGPTATTGPRSVSVTNAAPGGGTVSLANAFTVNPGVPSSVELISGLIPTEFGLMQNYPNPFNPATSIRFALPERSSVKLTLFNTLGIEVSVLVDDELEPGVYQYRLAADQLPTGMYIYTLKAQSSADGTSKAYSSSKKMVLVK